MKKFLITNFKKALQMGFFHLLSANIFLQIAGFGMQIFLTKLLAPEDIGRIRVLQSFIGIAVIFAGIGLNTAVLKYCSEDITDKEKKKIFINALKIAICTSLVTTVVMVLLSLFNLYSKDLVTNQYIKIYLFIIPFMVINGLIIAYMQSQRRVKEMSRMQILVKCINIIVVVIAVSFLGFKGYVYGMLLGVSLDVFAFLIFLREEIRSFPQIQMARQYFTKLFYLGKYGFLTNALGQLIASTDIILLNYFIQDPAKIGFYGTAQLVIMGLRLIPLTLNQLVVPYVSNSAGNLERVRQIYRGYQKKTLLIMSAVTLISFFVGPWGIKLVFGERYAAAIPFFQILLVGLFIWSIYAPKGIILFGLGYVNYNFYSGAIVQIFNVCINLFLINRFGAQGAAFATVLSYLLGMFVTGYFYNKAMKSGQQSIGKVSKQL